VAYVLAGAVGDALWVRELSSLRPRLLPETAGARAPFFSPDGEQVGFFSGGQLKVAPVGGGPVKVVAEARSGRGGTWCADGSIVYAPDVRGGLFKVPPGGTPPERLTAPNLEDDERSHRWPTCLSDGSAVLFLVQFNGKDYDDGAVVAVSLKSGDRKLLHMGGAYPRVMADRHLLFARQGQLFHAPLNAAGLTLTARPRPVLDDLMSSTGNQAAGDGSAQFAVNDAGLLIYREGWDATNRFPLIWVDREGNTSPAHDQAGTYYGPRFSPDGRKIALASIIGSKNDISVLNLDDGHFTRLTFGDAAHYFPVWTRDGQYVSYSRDTDLTARSGLGGTGIYVKRADGSGTARLIYQGRIEEDDTGQRIAMINPSSWSPDGRTLLVHESTEQGGWDLSLLHLDENGEMETYEGYATTQFAEMYGEFSPDGSLIAYQSDESGAWQVYVRPYPDTGGRWQVSAQGGAYPRWSGDGTELFFRSGQDVMAVVVRRQDGSGRPTFGKPSRLFAGSYLDLSPFSAYDVAPDGQRFVMFPGPTDAGSDGGKAVAIFNWLQELEQ
jgi:serine/threonine-protein kinase